MQLRHALPDALQDIVAHFFGCAPKRVPEGEGVCRAVTLDHDAAQTEQTCTIVAAGIHPAAERAEHRLCGESGKPP